MNWSKIKISLICVICCFACNVDQLDFDNIEVQDISPQIAIPLGSVSYTIEELLEDLNDSTVTIGSDDDQVVFLSFSDSASFEVGEEFVSIDDVMGDGVISLGMAVPPVPEAIRIPFEQEFEFVYDDQLEEQLDSVFYSDGQVNLLITSTCACGFNYEFTIENTRNVATDDPLSFAGEAIFSGSTPLLDARSASLQGYKTALENEDNIFRSVLRGEFILGAGQEISAEDQISFEFTYQNQEFSSIFGFFGQDTVTISAGEVEIEFFENAVSEGIVLSGPTIEFNFSNRFGIPIGVLTNEVFGVNSQNDTLRLSGAVPSNPQIIGFNTENIGEPFESSFIISPDNSNIRDFFALAPSLVEFPITGISNPGASDGFNYLLDDSIIETELNFTLPLRFRLENFEQSFDFDIDEGLDVDEIDSLALQLVTRNNIPFRANMDISITDTEDQVIFTAVESLIIEPPTTNILGEITSDSETISRFDLGQEGTEALRNAGRISIRLVLNSPSTNVNEFFDLLLTNSLEVQASVIGTANIEL